MGVFIDSKLHFHNHVDYIFSQCMKLFGLVRTITLPFSSTGSLYMLYYTLIRSKLEYASIVWNSVITTDANKLEHIQQKFAALCYNRFFPPSPFHLFQCTWVPYNSILYVREEIISMLFSLFKFTLVLNSAHLYWKLLAFVSLLGTSETFLCTTFALQLKTVLLLDGLQLLMLSAGTLISLEDIMFPLNTFYCKQDIVCMLSIYLIVCVHIFSNFSKLF
jgi:hypothetical protein